MASSNGNLDVNDYHENIIRQYVRYSVDQRDVGLRSFRAAANDFRNQRVSDEAMMTVDEVNEFFEEFLDMIEREFEQEITHQYRVNALLIKQLFQQAEKWFLKLNPNFDQLENRQLIDLIRNYEEQHVKKQKLHSMKETNSLLDPINDTKSTILLKTEIQKLQQLNQQLKERLSQYVDDDELLQNQLEENSRSFSKKEQTFSEQLKSAEQRFKEVQHALSLAENELEKKFNQTNTYITMKKIIEQKNQQIRQLREQVATREMDDNDDDD